ncbi:MAG: L,D-transpeptidase family protein [Pseudolabrys sp.]
MRTVRFDHLLAGTALSAVLGLTLALATAPANAQSSAPTVFGVQADVPDVPPITDGDFSFGDQAPQAPVAPVAPAAVVAPAPVTAAPGITTTAAPLDSAISDRLRDIVTGKIERTFGRKNERTAVEAFYKERSYAPLWISNGVANDRAKAAAGYLATVDRDGLDPSEYPTPDLKAAADADALADVEIKLTAAVLTYARHALNGRVAYSRVSADIYYNHPVTEPQEVLAKLAGAADVAATLDSFEPQQVQYKALKKALADVRSGTITKEPDKVAEPKTHVPEGKILRPGMKDERVLALRKRLDLGDKDSNVYDAAVAKAVKQFQKENDLGADGNLGANTVRAMNGEKPAAAAKIGNPVDTIIVNLDRWRWMPRKLGNPYVVVNIPDYRLTLYKDDQVYWTTKIVVGQAGKPTPLISAEMKFITVNPTWNVPPSIIENEYLPALQEDPGALDRIGLKVTQDADGTVHISQPPGAGNALGRIRFNFPNKFLVYQHDTPDKHLFAKDKRAFSHGCMRVENPLMYGEKLLSLVLPDEHYTQARLEKMFGSNEININFPESKRIPVHLTYQTAFVDSDGKLQLRQDVYGRDAQMFAQLRGSERKVADIAIERPANTSGKPVRVAPGMYGGSHGYSYGYGSNDGGNFFEWIFGGPRNLPPQPVQRRTQRGGRASFR